MASLIRTTVLACLLGTAAPALAAEQITFVSQGGAYQQAQTVAILDPAAKALGITINQDSAPDAWPVIRTQGATGKPTWDVVDTPTQDCVRGGKAGLIEKLDFSKIPNAAAIPASYKTEYSVPYEFYSSVLAYNKSKYGKNPPQSWADFWDVKKFPGARALRNHPFATLEAALMADGVAPADVYKTLASPGGVDRAFKKLEELKPHVLVWWNSGAQSAQILQDGEVDMVGAWNGRIQAAMKEKEARGGPLAITFEQQMLVSDCWLIPKGAPNKDLAMKAIAIMMRPDVQARLPQYINYAPANLAAFETGLISKELAAQLPNSPENIGKGFLLSVEWWVKNSDEMVKRFDAFVQK